MGGCGDLQGTPAPLLAVSAECQTLSFNERDAIQETTYDCKEHLEDGVERGPAAHRPHARLTHSGVYSTSARQRGALVSNRRPSEPPYGPRTQQGYKFDDALD